MKYWYASVQDAGKTGLILGPFREEAACRRWAYDDPARGGDPALHKQLRDAAERTDPRSVFYAFGMTSVETALPPRIGALNARLEGKK